MARKLLYLEGELERENKPGESCLRCAKECCKSIRPQDSQLYWSNIAQKLVWQLMLFDSDFLTVAYKEFKDRDNGDRIPWG